MAPNIINKILGKDDASKDSTSSDTSTTGGLSSHKSQLDDVTSSSTASTTGTGANTGSTVADGTYNTVDQTTAAPVEHERVSRIHEDQVQEVVDKEIHQDHHHTTVQPIKDSEVRPEQHQHVQVATEHREFDHGDDSKLKERLAAEQAQFSNKRTEGATEVTQSQNPTLVGEHKHTHVHETIQPVIEKETVIPSVTHTTVPIKEVHQEAAVVHGTSTAPTISLQEFQAGQGTTGSTGSSGRTQI